MSKLRDLNIIPNGGSSAKLFEELFPKILDVEYFSPSNFISKNWAIYENNPIKNNNLNGAVFEYLLASIFYLEGIKPLFFQAQVVFVPNVNFDFLCYSNEFGPVVFSAKTSLRERYKQADLEAIALKYVHRKAKSYLVTLNEIEAKSVNKKIISGDVIGIDNVIVATSSEFDELIKNIKKYDFIKPDKVEIIKSLRIIE
ncbi:MAG: hypothetical protein L3J15_07660 [Devosiaceae bacterium]|nr:hypothetical protein [Devosiaceae bacterium]